MKYEIIFVIFSFIYNNFIPMVGESVRYFMSYDKAAQDIIETAEEESESGNNNKLSGEKIAENFINKLGIKLEGTMGSIGSGVGSFVVASYTVPLMTKTLGTHELVKKATQIIPHQSHSLLTEN